ncbi:MAG: hypothetical protein IPJ77_03525 [Planctomycetes bacterium]|nr:hypothetical protein [Planctomycetota bacterium]
MLRRFARPSLALFGLAAPLAAQSSVKPLPEAARPSALAWKLAAPRVAESAPLTDEVLEPRERRGGPNAAGVEPAERAQLPRNELVAASAEDGPKVELGLDAFASPSTNLKGAAGSTDVARGGWNARLGWRAGEDQGFTLGLSSEASFYRFSNATSLLPGSGTGEPLNDVYETSLGATLVTRSSQRTSFFTSAALTLGGEDNASLGESLTLAAVTGVRYEAHEDLTLDAGLAALTLHEGAPWVLPYLGFEWRIDDGWRLGFEGSKIELACDLGEHWTLAGKASYELRQYRLNDDGPAQGGAFRDQEIDVGAAIEWRPRAGASLRLDAGLAVWRELEFFDAAGHKLSETEVDPAPYVALALELGF